MPYENSWSERSKSSPTFFQPRTSYIIWGLSVRPRALCSKSGNVRLKIRNIKLPHFHAITSDLMVSYLLFNVLFPWAQR